MPRSLLALTMALLAACSIAHETRAEEAVRHPYIDSLAVSLVSKEVPGLAVLAIRQGRVLHRAAYGTVSSASPAPVTTHTPFYVASTGKMFTAAAILTLVAEGKLGLDEPAARYLDNIPEIARGATIRQLLTHTSGVPDYYELGGEERAYSNEDVLGLLRQADTLAFVPGSRADYSNSGYVLLALVVEAVTKKEFGDFLEDRFFDPFDMDDAFVAAGEPLPRSRAVGHRKKGEGFEAFDYYSSTTGSGGVYASLADLERWYRALREHRVLDEATLRLASRPPKLDSGRLTPYGMGWLAEFAGRGPLKDKWYVFAFGSLRGFRAVFQWYPEDDVLWVWLANGSSDAVFDRFAGVTEQLMTAERSTK